MSGVIRRVAAVVLATLTVLALQAGAVSAMPAPIDPGPSTTAPAAPAPKTDPSKPPYTPGTLTYPLTRQQYDAVVAYLDYQTGVVAPTPSYWAPRAPFGAKKDEDYLIYYYDKMASGKFGKPEALLHMPCLPLICDNPCYEAPIPQMPGAGLSGYIDGATTYPPPWTTFGWGCSTVSKFSDPGATLDTTLGNWIKGAGTVVVAVANGLHRIVSPPTFMQRLNPLLMKGSAALRAALFTPFYGIVLLLIGLGIIVAARKKNLPKAVEATVWAVFVLALATALWSYPVQAGRAVDSTATTIIGTVNDHMGATVPGRDPSAGRAKLLTDNDLYPQWVRGEIGTEKPIHVGGQDDDLGHLLLAASTFTPDDVAALNSGKVSQAELTKTKQDNFKRLATWASTHDPAAYNQLTGKGGGRIGAGTESLIAAVFTAPFLIAADILVIVALFIIRFLVIFFPAIALVGMFLAGKGLVVTVFEKAFAAVLNAIVFAVGAAVNTMMVGFILSPAMAMPAWAELLLCGVVTAMLWGALRPFRRLGRMVRPGQVAAGAEKGARDVGKSRRRGARVVKKIQKVGRHHDSRTKPAPVEVPASVPETWSRPVVVPERARPTPPPEPAADVPTDVSEPVPIYNPDTRTVEAEPVYVGADA